MTGNEIALDTSQAIAVLHDIGDAERWVQAFTDVYLPVPVVGELRFGALKSQRVMENLSRVEQLVVRCKVLEVKATTAEVYASIRLQLKQKGKPAFRSHGCVHKSKRALY
jgi:tRNA(fMet)-specific endonuclease VapC